jgi:LPS-assembly protein
MGYIGYDLAEIADDTPSLARATFSLDSGLYFDRNTRWGSRGFTQTLEPRLFYLYVPNKNQNSLPNFDTSEPDLSFDNLFRENRFVGGDRIGDAKQATFALTTRLLDDEGVERFRASVGQIYYFDDRKVNIPAEVDTVNSSDIVAETRARLVGNWYVQGNIQHNRNTRDTQKSSVYLQYHPRKNSIVNLGRRFIRDEIEQTDISLEWPLYQRWTLRARSIYSQRDDRNVESYAGLEYNACCWAMRLFGNRRLTEDGDQVNFIMFELELTGLAKLGSTPVSPLQQGVFSFTNPADRIR